MQNIRAEILLPTQELRDDIPFFTRTLGMRMDEIFPADDPREAVFSGHGLRVRVRKDAPVPPGILRLLCDDPILIADGATELLAPNGTKVEIGELAPPVEMPMTQHSFVVRRLADQAPWVVGRAGMEYRDLIPDRLGGSIIASHIRIPGGGPVPDMVHYHSVGFQLIFCYRGWVDLVYEDQGPPFRLEAGNCVIQPPEIRHRVLHSSENLEVIEIGVPADHVTTIDHEMELPNDVINEDREFEGQKFVHHRANGAPWMPHARAGFVARETGIREGTKGVASVMVLKRGEGDVRPQAEVCDIHFSFVMVGSLLLEAEGHEPCPLSAGDAFVLPPGLPVSFTDASQDIEILEVKLPG